ncbi:MAG: hypothetical protein Q7S92_01150 [Candidatus Diapherotrites archaeon]|nr:hypothetical protein [Candidatus Diapherotrites archaeon]
MPKNAFVRSAKRLYEVRLRGKKDRRLQRRHRAEPAIFEQKIVRYAGTKLVVGAFNRAIQKYKISLNQTQKTTAYRAIHAFLDFSKPTSERLRQFGIAQKMLGTTHAANYFKRMTEIGEHAISLARVETLGLAEKYPELVQTISGEKKLSTRVLSIVHSAIEEGIEQDLTSAEIFREIEKGITDFDLEMLKKRK